MTVVRIGTRGSALALTQTQRVADALSARGAEVEIVTVTTHGDTSSASLSEIGGTGVFASALREALLAGRCDVVVHSLKDLPTVPTAGLTIGAIPKRVDARDAVIARDSLTLDTLPEGARVGTGSPRRAAQLRSRRSDLVVVDIRGNVDTRIGRVASGELDAVVLAAAGLERLGRAVEVIEYLPLDGWPTAPGQGALALEVRTGEERLVAALDHRASRTMVEAERAVLAILGAGCAAPIAARAFIDDGMLFLDARVYSPSGAEKITSSHALYLDDSPTPGADAAGRVAAELIALGASDLAPLGSIDAGSLDAGAIDAGSSEAGDA